MPFDSAVLDFEGEIETEEISQLPIDHPGANDAEYRKRRDYIAQLAKEYRLSKEKVIPTIDYTVEETKVWREATTKLEELHQRRACNFYLKAKETLGICTEKIPQLAELDQELKSITGFRLAPIEGLVETRGFLSWLEKRTMLSTQYIRHHSRPDYTPEPDIIHEAVGHIPCFTNANFADYSQFVGKGARIADDEQLERLGRLYWFTVEFGLVEEEGEIKAYGAGLLSSVGELENAFSDNAERRPFDLEEVVDTEYDYSDMQPVLFVVRSFAVLKETTRKFIESF
jgi:phenylalanine-4-hydroxylase